MDPTLIAAFSSVERLRRTPLPASNRDAMRSLEAILREAVGLTGCSKGSIWLVDPRRGGLRCMLGLEDEHRHLSQYRLREGEGITGFSTQVGEPLVINDVSREKRHSSQVDQILSIRTRQIISCPLISHGVVLGAMNVLNRGADVAQEFDNGDLFVARLFATAVADHILENHLAGGRALHGGSRRTPSRIARPGKRASAASAETAQPLFTSPAMERIAAEIRAGGERNLLLTGETGVGKDLLARWAHDKSRVADGPFIAINCAAIQEGLWESEIFGHAKGSFTGADKDKPGHVEEADGGTLFLNEIGDMPAAAQAKLLSFLDSGEFVRVGETRAKKIRARVVAATNCELEEVLRTGRFRRDLFYRLAQVHIHVPPLRERTADILALAAKRLHDLAAAKGLSSPWLADETREMLVRYPWPGNARQLFSAVESAFCRCEESEGGVILPQHFAVEISEGAALQTEKDRLIPSHPGGVAPDHMDPIGEILDSRFMRPSGMERLRAPSHARPFVSIFDEPDQLMQYVQRHKCLSSGRLNLSAAFRELKKQARVKGSLRTFSRRVGALLAAESVGSVSEMTA